MTYATRERERHHILDHIGNTPLLKLERLAPENPRVRIYAKAEWFNPGGSIKDRPALRIIEEAERQGLLTRGKTIIDATSGNTGIGYALVGAAKGYPVTLVMPANVTEERKQIARAYGATLIETDPEEGIDGAIHFVHDLVARHPDRYFHADQYSNPANWRAHYETTGPEIWAQTRGRITHFVAGLGTTGTMTGVGRFLREMAPHVCLVGVQPIDGAQGIEGLKHLASSLVPSIWDPGLLDLTIRVAREDVWEMARRLAREEGWFVGLSAAAAVLASLRLADTLDEGVIVTILPDAGLKYVSLGIW
ncbi:MAG: PLP-dependent cysteine synthase family protein [Chloroflexi bacterium]|nr:PLP-dependent cysteine synthase family protein [Chloroflexota bacterium]